jgi:hypothetical protein
MNQMNHQLRHYHHGDTPDSDVEAENDDAGQYEMDDDAGELFGVNNDADPSMAAM